jgi:hypothetical protein
MFMKIKTILGIIFSVIYIKLHAQQTVGLTFQKSGSMDGYVLFAPLNATTTYLINKCGKVVHTWQSDHRPGQEAYLLPDGTLLRPRRDVPVCLSSSGGVIEKLDWDSHVIWSYRVSDSTNCQHHDVCPLPNGNILAIAWEKKTNKEAMVAGRNALPTGNGLWSEKIIELKPIGKDSAAIVWEWRVWDHLVQDYNPAGLNYGIVSENPQLININHYAVGAEDWLHFNSVAYNAKLDQIIISIRNFSEFIIIDHGTTTSEAATHSGGKRNKGGDVLYRWGNPITYNAGTKSDKKLFGQHAAHWIPKGFDGAGKILVFNNNRQGKAGITNSSVDIIDPPMDRKGNYKQTKNKSYLPDSASWSYVARIPESFHSRNSSSAQRLSNGNTIICVGAYGQFFEIDKKENIVWMYKNPVKGDSIVSQGTFLQQDAPVFKCIFYETSYSGLKNRVLSEGKPIESNPQDYPCMTK